MEKRPAYAGLGIPEYWRFDETGEFHGTRLAGDRLVDRRYEPVPIETVEEGVLQGYSRVLNLIIRWDHGQLGCTTRRPGNTSSGTRTSRPGSGNWRRSWSGAGRADHLGIEDPLLWEKLSIFLSFLVNKLPVPVEEDLSRGMLDAVDMESYRMERRAA